MNAPNLQIGSPRLHQIDAIFELQREAARREPYPAAGQRKAQLSAICRLLLEHGKEMAVAISADFGHRSTHETQVLEIFPALQNVKHARWNVGRWMRPERKHVSMLFQPGRARVIKQPLGVAGVIVPWNYPLYLAVGPMISALAAGNRVMLKLSEMTPRFGELFEQLVGKYFPQDQVAVVNGGVDVAQAFAAKPFDHLLFTGSTSVGRQVMRTASQNLTPVTLELGGKSPALIGPDFPVDVAAQRIIWGKCLNAGQTCIAPDYVLVPEGKVDEFIGSARDEVKRLYPEGAASSDYTAIINGRHHSRLTGYLKDAEAKGAQITSLATGSDEALRKMAPAILTQVHDEMLVMQEEIFGPILPIVPYGTLDEALSYIADRAHPLAMYYFDYDGNRIRRVLNECAAGGVTINDTILHIGQENLPFGGVGPSGMGHYHGEEGFNTFSKRKAVFVQSRLNGLRLFKPPFGRRIDTILSWLLR